MLGENLLPVGNINKVGNPVSGKQTYELIDNNRNRKYTYIVPEENADTFEKLYDEINTISDSVNTAEKQEELKEQGKKLGNRMKNYVIAGASIGTILPATIAFFAKGKVWKRTVFGLLGSIGGAILGTWGTTYFGFQNGIKNLVKNNPAYQKLEEISKQADELGVERQIQNLQA